jgi:hypothetical protein
MTKTEQNILNHLRPITEFADTYFCFVGKFSSDRAMENMDDKVRRWVEKNGGKYRTSNDKIIIGEHKGYIVKIVFPTFNKRDMKNIMATIY